MTANTALAPLAGTNGLYGSLGVDLIIEATGDDDARFLEWVDFTGADDEFSEDAADAILTASGYRRTGDWEPTATGEYFECAIEVA